MNNVDNNILFKRLIIVSNRVPAIVDPSAKAKRDDPVGGLVSAIYPTLREKGGIWFGWSGKVSPRKTSGMPVSRLKDNIDFLTVDLSEKEIENYYTGFSNRTLWPLFHSFPTKVTLRGEEFKAYNKVNRKLAYSLFPFLKDGDIIWVQDYHLIPFATHLKDIGWNGPIGFFLHTPFPPADIFRIIPWAKQILEDFLNYDLVGFHTQRFRRNFENSLIDELDGTLDDHHYRRGLRELNIGVFPIGIDREIFKNSSKSTRALKQAGQIITNNRGNKIILGVDRLDYTKGIIERLKSFERLLERYPSWKGKVTMIQISSPSRTRIPEYINQKREVDQLVGEINGRLSEADWTPIIYLYRSYVHELLAGFYRASDVCLVSPLRDGMNLVSKEYIASQNPDNPGVLLLSRFCGAAEDLKEAVIINPYDIDGTAKAMKKALEMQSRERKDRWLQLMQRISKNSAQSWRDRFLFDLVTRETGIHARAENLGPRLLDGVHLAGNNLSKPGIQLKINQLSLLK